MTISKTKDGSYVVNPRKLVLKAAAFGTGFALTSMVMVALADWKVGWKSPVVASSPTPFTQR